MYKFFSFCFFSLTVGFLSFLLIDSTNFIGSKIFIFFFVTLFILYASYALYFLFETLFHTKKFLQPKKSVASIVKKFPVLSKRSTLLTSVFTIVFFVLIITFGILSGTRFFFWTVSGVLSENIIYVSDSFKNTKEILTFIKNIKATEERSHVKFLEENERKFFENNQLVYKKDIDNGSIFLTHTSTLEGGVGYTNLYAYRLRFCEGIEIADFNCYNVGLSRDDYNHVSQDYLRFYDGEIIQNIDVSTIESELTEQPFIIVSIETNNRSMPLIMYPTSIETLSKYALFDATISSEPRMSYIIENTANQEQLPFLNITRVSENFNTVNPEYSIVDEEDFIVRFELSQNKIIMPLVDY